MHSPFKDEWANIGIKSALYNAASQGSPGLAIVRGEDAAKVTGGPPDKLGIFYDQMVPEMVRKLIDSKGSTPLPRLIQ